MTYQELKESHRARLQAFPLEWAFNEAQLQDAFRRLGATRDDICSAPGGGILRKADVPALRQLLSDLNRERDTAFADDATLLEEAMHYELGNYEYCITGDAEPALAALGLSVAAVDADPRMQACFVKALRRYRDGHGA